MISLRYTNSTGLPEPLAQAIILVSQKYSPGDSDFTTTELTGPPRIRALRLRAEKKGITMEVDVSDLLHSVMGQAVHYVIEEWAKGDPESYLCEERLYNDFNSFKIGGQIDLYIKASGVLRDWKYTKSTTYRDGVKAEYIQQLNINAWLLRANNYTPKTLYSVPIYRDYSKLTAHIKPPRKHSDDVPVSMWPDGSVERLLRERIELHVQAERELPLCTEEERWPTSSVWATESLKSGRAIRHGLSKTREEAEKKRAAHKYPNTLGVIHRPGKSQRCEHYCPMSSICDQWKNDPNNPANLTDQPDLFTNP